MAEPTITQRLLLRVSPFDLWTFFQFFFPTVAAALMGWAWSLAGQPVHIILAAALIGGATAAIIVDGVRKVVRDNRVFQNLWVAKTETLLARYNPATNTIALMFKGILTNNSETKPIYIKLRRAHVVLQGKANPDPQLNEIVTIVPPRKDQTIQYAAVYNLNVEEVISGRTEIEILYGPSQEKLPYLLTYETTPAITVDKIVGNQADITVVMPVRKCEHSVAWKKSWR